MAKKQWDNRYVGGYIPKDIYESLPDEDDEVDSAPESESEIFRNSSLSRAPGTTGPSGPSRVSSNSIRDAVYSGGLIPNYGNGESMGVNDGFNGDARQAGNNRRFAYSQQRAISNFGKYISKLLR